MDHRSFMEANRQAWDQAASVYWEHNAERWMETLQNSNGLFLDKVERRLLAVVFVGRSSERMME